MSSTSTTGLPHGFTQPPLEAKCNWDSGPVPDGAEFSFWLERAGNTDNVPRDRVQWDFRHNGVRLNPPGLKAITHDGNGFPVAVLHTFKTKEIGFIMRPGIRGLLEAHAYGEDGLDRRWAFRLGELKQAPSPGAAPQVPITPAEIRIIVSQEIRKAAAEGLFK